MCWSFFPIGIRQAKIRKKAEMQVVFLLKTSLAIQNTISFAPRSLRLLPIHISLHLPQRDKKTRKSTEKISSLLWNVMSACQMCWCVTILNASLLYLSCVSWVRVCILSLSSTSSLPLSFDLPSSPSSLLCIFVCAFWLLYVCVHVRAYYPEKLCFFAVTTVTRREKMREFEHENTNVAVPNRVEKPPKTPW